MRKLLTTAALIAALIIGAADASQAATHHHRKPNRSELALLRQIQHIDPHGHCHLEWDGRFVHHHWVDAYYEVICAR